MPSTHTLRANDVELDHIGLSVTELIPATRFFVSALGASIEFTEPGKVMLRVGAQSIELIEARGRDEGGDGPRLTFLMTDVR